MKKKITILSGAGLSQESGISTFRDIKDGLWYNYKVDDVATLDGWKRDRETVIEFRNMLNSKMLGIEPNDAHKYISKLEDYFDVIVVTQNVDNLHEKAGSNNILHIHGELNKANSSVDPKIVYDKIGDILIGDKCIKGSQLKPNLVLFGEYPYRMEEAIKSFRDTDYVIVVGTGFNIPYTIDFLTILKNDCKVFYVDIEPTKFDFFDDINIEIIKDKATTGMKYLFNKLINK